jgi:hypothetical protein
MEQDASQHFDLRQFEVNLESDHEVIELLAGDLLCPLCNCAYDAGETRIVRELGNSVTVAVQCHCCGTGSLIALETPAPGPLLPAELTPVERAYFAYLPPLRDDDVKRIRALLRNHRGDLRDLV